MTGDPAPFGTHAPTRLQALVIGLAVAGPLSPVLRRGAFRYPLARLIRALRAGPIDVERNGIRYRLDVSDNAAEVGLLLDPHYQQISLDFVRSHLAEGGTMVDCGANVGQYALVAAQRVGATGRAVAVEATDNPMQRLLANATLSGLSDRIAAFACAVGDADGELRFAVNPADTALSHASETGDVVVPMKSLLTICREAGIARIDVLKIDVEGMEDRVLTAFFRDAPEALWPRAICMEDELADAWQGDIRPMLARIGYTTLAGRSKGNAFLVRSAG
ncbi:FkbM family methyltransferase [Phreatobacter sp.]|uniref:FkbM family methyltransferase n=1 Tax=Phreatobacter sp. TaxID=1966341 RepID=UPI003F7049E6